MKENVLKELFQLSQADILDIGKIIKGYAERIHKYPSDTLLMRCIFMNGYHSIKQFCDENLITKDSNLASVLNYETANIKAYLKLKNILSIDDEIFIKIINELGELYE